MVYMLYFKIYLKSIANKQLKLSNNDEYLHSIFNSQNNANTTYFTNKINEFHSEFSTELFLLELHTLGAGEGCGGREGVLVKEVLHELPPVLLG